MKRAPDSQAASPGKDAKLAKATEPKNARFTSAKSPGKDEDNYDDDYEYDDEWDDDVPDLKAKEAEKKLQLQSASYAA